MEQEKLPGLYSSNYEIQAILDTISIPILVTSPDNRKIMVNQYVCDLTGSTKEDWISKSGQQLIEEGLMGTELVSKAISTGKDVSEIVRAKNGTKVISRCRPICDKNNKLIFLVTTAVPLLELSELWMALENESYKNENYYSEIDRLRKDLKLEDLCVFESPSSKLLLENVKRIAPIDCTILITGESGVGKDMLVKIIHMNSPRQQGHLITVSIPAIPENLLEAELFGYEEGAFTGSARGGKAGLFELANEGTLFLDEIGDVPYNIQVKILRAIENGEIRRVGGTKTIKLNTRIIAATNRDLIKAIKNGLFREDLYYRLSVVQFYIKPLRERKEDIQPLCHHFLQKLNKRYGSNKQLSEQAFNEIRKYNWPGNVRELKNNIERLVIFANGDLITDEDVKHILNLTSSPQPVDETKCSDTLEQEYESFEKSRILEVLKQTGGNKTKAAELLGMTRNKLYRKLRSL